MKQIQACPACGAEAHQGWPSVVAPFLVERALRERPPIGHVYQCGCCGLRFSNIRLNEDEVTHLYQAYRGEEYFQCRHRHEPWYSRRMNGDLGGDSKEIQHRQECLETLLQESSVLDRIQTVLDYGGDRGQFIPAGLLARKWVFEISGVEPIQGVELITDFVQLANKSFDLVMLCHVLEHVMEPRTFLHEVMTHVTSAGFLYIEIPLERPHINSVSKNMTITWYQWLDHHPFCLRIIDFLSTASRMLLGWLPPLGLLKTSEHVNFFDESSLQALLAAEGFSCLRIETTQERRLAGRIGVVRCLAVKDEFNRLRMRASPPFGAMETASLSTP